MIDIVHRRCGGIAFRMYERPIVGVMANPDSVVMPDGSTPREGTPMVCGNCGEPVAFDPLDVVDNPEDESLEDNQ